MLRAASILAFALLVVGCQGATDEPLVGTTMQAIIGGTVSTAAQDAAVEIDIASVPDDGSFSLCTGTLIAPNLVLTAHHCVAEPGTSHCMKLGEQKDPARLTIYAGVDAPAADRRPVAKGKQIFVPGGDNVCSFDVALVLLDRDITTVQAAPICFAAPAKGEQVTAVGYGRDDSGERASRRLQRTTTVLGVGPSDLDYATRSGDALPTYAIPSGDIATGESHCKGDSGGPLFDASGNLVGVVSRSYPIAKLAKGDTSHGTLFCDDLPEIYASVGFNADFIRATATSLGIELLDVESIRSDTLATDPSSGSANTRSATHSSSDEAAAGCSAAPARRGSLPRVLLLLATALVFIRRRRGRHAQ